MTQPENTPLNFSRRPDPADMPLDWHVASIPAKGVRGATILSADVTGAYVHFAKGRTQPCTGATCEHCDGGTRRRWEGYLAVTDRRCNTRLILRLTPAAMPPIDSYYKEHRTLRGATLAVTRRDAKPNGKLFTTVAEGATRREHLPKAPNLPNILARMWGLTDAATPAATDPPRVAPETRAETDFGDEKEVG